MKLVDIIFGDLLLEYQETRVQGILRNNQIMDKLQSAAEKDHSAQFRPDEQSVESGDLLHVAEPILRQLAEADPTTKSAYLNWIVSRYGRGGFMLEDLSRVKDALTKFKDFKPKMPETDINQYEHLADLQDALDAVMDDGKPVSKRQERSEIVDRIKSEEIKVIINTPDFKVLSPLSPEASNYLGYSTGPKLRWCTLNREPLPNYAPDSDNQTNHYLSMGPLYQIIVHPNSANTRSFLVHVKSDQFMDERDLPVSKKDIKMLSEFPEYQEFLNLLIGKHYGKYLDS